jgi:hypothetical protein
VAKVPQEKADKALVAKLALAPPEEELTVILEIAEPAVSIAQDLSLDSAGRARAAEKAFSTTNHPVTEKLTNLGLKPRGGRYAPVVVITGRADAVREAIALDAVSGAALDESLDLIEPERPGAKKSP